MLPDNLKPSTPGKYPPYAGPPPTEEVATATIFLPMLRLRYGNDVSFYEAVGKLWDEVEKLAPMKMGGK